MKRLFLSVLTLLFMMVYTLPALADQESLLASWRSGTDSQAKENITAFVDQVIGGVDHDDTAPGYVPPSDRIAVFDNDGTLWAEQPFYVPLLFETDLSHGGGLGFNGTTEEYTAQINTWLEEQTHPDPRFTGRHYTEMIYQPMRELLDYLRANEFKTFIVSGGGVEFMRPWTEDIYGIPAEQVVGSSVATKFEDQGDTITDPHSRYIVKRFVKKAPNFIDSLFGRGEDPNEKYYESAFLDDGPGKPVGITQNIGRRPIASFGNSDGDLEMHQWIEAGTEFPHFSFYIHHTDDVREWDYEKCGNGTSSNECSDAVGVLADGLNYAEQYGWTVADMAADWTRVFPFQPDEG